MNTSLYLTQSYQDAWSDYRRSLSSLTFPVWDDLILTASNAHQAESFRSQIDARRDVIPSGTSVAVIPDEGGVRVGSGGATLSVLRYLHEKNGGFSGRRTLVIHSGGDSKRTPQYSALGKLFSPVPHLLPDGRNSTLFDEFLIAMSAVPGRIREGMLLLSGDVLLLFNPLLIDYSGHGAAVISFKEDVQTGKDHGVYLRGEDGYVRAFLHKQSVETLTKAGAVNDAGAVDIDTGAMILGTDVLDALWGLISDESGFDEAKYRSLVNGKVRLSLYGDFQYPLATDSTREGFYEQAPEGTFTPELKTAREALWQALRPFRMKLLRLAPAKFIHFGTTAEILSLMNSGVNEYTDMGWSARVNCSMDRCSGYNSVLSPQASIGEDCYLEVSYVHERATVGKGCVLSYIDVLDETVPDHVVLHGLKQSDGRFVCRIFGTGDNPKENRLFGRELKGSLWHGDDPHTLWHANLYPECATIREALRAALALHRAVTEDNWEAVEAIQGKSLAAGFNDADSEAILAWNNRMAELVRMNAIAARIKSRAPAEEGTLTGPMSALQKDWLEERLANADYSEKMRLHYYTGKALRDERQVALAFSVLSGAIQEAAVSTLKENRDARIVSDSTAVSLPLRVNWGGGWSDTPPYCNENGGTVINAAVLLGGDRPVKVTLKKLAEKKVVFESRDMDVHGEFDTIEPLQAVGDPFDSFVLQKAALLACGVIPAKGGNLTDCLARLGGGFLMDTEVVGVPKGSGLGTSSILAAACVKALSGFLGISYTEDDLYSRVLCMEQIMSTGGGWQDQVGGVTDGIKYTTSRPGLGQELKVEHIRPDRETMRKLDERFALIYTGQRRLARNLLRDIVGRYIGNHPDTVGALNEIQRIAALMRFELERGNVDAFAGLLSEHWKLSKTIDAGSTNTLIDQIFDAVDDLVAGKMVCGAGGGGFLQVMLKEHVSKAELQRRLSEVFQDTEIRVWDCTLTDAGD